MGGQGPLPSRPSPPPPPNNFQGPREPGGPLPPSVPQEQSKSIRNIPITVNRTRPRYDDALPSGPLPPRRRASRIWLWGGVLVALLALAAMALVALRPTSVTVVPRSHAILFDETARFTAYPATTAAEGTLPFTLRSTTFEDSQVVAASGTQHVDEKASGNVTVYNNYSADPVKLIKTTRFESSNGLIFKVPAEVIVPGKKGTTPGQITITVIAELPGEKYNIGPDSFKLPGLKSTLDMYTGVTARSTEGMVGGFSGDRAAIDKSTEDATRAEIRARLEQKARDAGAAPEGGISFPELTRLRYETLPLTSEAGGSVRMNERAVIEVPVFTEAQFAGVIARSVNAEAGGDLLFVPGDNLRATRLTSTDVPLTEPLEFTLEGSALLVWVVDEGTLKSALAGKGEDAFQSIVGSFPGIEEAHARIEPFWKKTFPPADAIHVTVEEPSTN